MTPIVDGLKEQYAGQIDFQFLDASSGVGEQLFEHYGMLGHPSYILLDFEGEEHWRGIGPVDKKLFEDEILKLIDGLSS